MKKYKIKQPLPQFGENIARVIEVPYEVVKEIRADAFDECKQILLSAMAKDGKTKCHEYMVALNEMEQLKEQKNEVN